MPALRPLHTPSLPFQRHLGASPQDICRCMASCAGSLRYGARSSLGRLPTVAVWRLGPPPLRIACAAAISCIQPPGRKG